MDNITTKEKLAVMLENGGDAYISGSMIAETLGITRSAVWKHIKALETDGYRIEAVTNRGYRLQQDNDVISQNTIRKYLGDEAGKFTLDIYSSTTSTNEILKSAALRSQTWHTVIASHQSAGKGRSGRSFYSPAESGLYLSMLLRPDMPIEKATFVTTAAAVAACRTIERCTDENARIKWVNDIFINEKKVCGILTEASTDMESGGLEWVIMGIGFNVYEPEGGFPDTAGIAGYILGERKRDLRSRIAAGFMIEFRKICEDLSDNDYKEEYKRRNFIPGKRINAIRGGVSVPAFAIGIDDECRLIVRYDDGREDVISSGEVSIRPIKA